MIHIGDDDMLIFIGDYVDRGPEAKVLIDTLLHLQSLYRNIVFIKGNHEDMLLGAAGLPAFVKEINTWLYNGGVQTLLSYGMERDEIGLITQLWDENARFRRISEFIPEGHFHFFQNLHMFIETDNYFICHAGVSAHESIREGKRNPYNLLWMRDHLYADSFAWEKTLVCGHTPVPEVIVTNKLICVDTGLYYYGKLSAIDVLTKEIYQVTR
jgi:serine/threonine protein phosphatase 1